MTSSKKLMTDDNKHPTWLTKTNFALMDMKKQRRCARVGCAPLTGGGYDRRTARELNGVITVCELLSRQVCHVFTVVSDSLSLTHNLQAI